MWNLTFKVLNKDSIYTLASKECSIKDFMYPLDHYIKHNKVFILSMHILEGNKQECAKFVRMIKANKKVKKCEKNENQLLVLIAEEESFYKELFSAELYHLSPVLIESGFERWSICSWNRNKLEHIIKVVEAWKDKLSNFQLINLKKTKCEDLYFPKIRQKLPEKQEKAFKLALERGYYAWPRKVNLITLAKEMKVSVPTFHENLRKAEKQLVPFFSSNI
jgi:predicted DNA binding protein